MRKGQFTGEQIIAIVREAESGASPPDICRRHGVKGETLRRWRATYRGTALEEAERLAGLREANRRLKRLVTEHALDVSLLTHLAGREW
jgi:putative transposase